ncbi:MAG: TetR/AcrR family transcriptional regulator [Bacteroidetes bacterium]|nr:TetR/AcrR family transcriptional regulator [Bacteroidota bacterium]
MNLFVEFGFHNTPTSKIAKEAGIANGTLFYFFPTKDDLVKALYIDLKSKLTKYIHESIDDKKPLKETLKGYYTATLLWGVKHKTELKFMEQFNSSPYLKQMAAEETQQYIQPILDLLKKGIKEKTIKTLDVDIIFTLVSGHTFSINQYLVLKQFPKKKQDKIISETFELLWDMIT